MISFSSQRKVAGIGAAFPVHYTNGNKSWVPGDGVEKSPIALLFSQLHTCPLCLSAPSLCSHFHGPRSTTGPQQVKQGPEFTY